MFAFFAAIALSAPTKVEKEVHDEIHDKEPKAGEGPFPFDDLSEPTSNKISIDDLETSSRPFVGSITTTYNSIGGWFFGLSLPFSAPSGSLISARFFCPNSHTVTACNCGYLSTCGYSAGSRVFKNFCICYWRSFVPCSNKRVSASLRC